MVTHAAHLSQADVDQLRSELLSRRDALVRAREAGADVERDLEDDEIEDADVAARKTAQEDALRLAHFDAGLLGEIEHALGKLDSGTYGLSEESGDPIPVERLRALPWARRTAPEEEQHARRAGR